MIIITLFIWFIFKYLRPKKKIEWKNTGILGAFLITLYAEMYGFPLTIYVLTSLFDIDIPIGHIGGHLWSSLLGLGVTLLMWPILALAYYGLAKKEEKEMERKFGETWQEYKNKVPMFLPSFKMLFAVQGSKKLKN